MTNLGGRILFNGFAAYLLITFLFVLGLTLWSDPMDFLSSKSHLLLWLEACPDNNVRFASDSSQVGELYGYVDLQNGNLGIEADPDNNNATTSAKTPRSIYSIPINPAQKAEIEHTIYTMPAQKVGLLEKYDFNRNIYFSFWKNHKFQTYVYPKDQLPEEVAGLLKGFKVNLADAIR